MTAVNAVIVIDSNFGISILFDISVMFISHASIPHALTVMDKAEWDIKHSRAFITLVLSKPDRTSGQNT